MAWSTPPTVVTGDIITASWGNTIRDLLRYLKGMDGAVTIDSALTATSFTGIGTGLTNLTMPNQFLFSTLAVSGTGQAAFSVNRPTGLVVATPVTQVQGVFIGVITGSSGGVFEVSDPWSLWSTGSGGPNFNLYHSAGNARYEVNYNNGTDTVRMNLIGWG